MSAGAKKKRKKKQGEGPEKDIWYQVYDTESEKEALLIRDKFRDVGIQSFVYEQGKKDVYGSSMKHYGISVPQQNVQKAQAVLAETAL